MTRRSTLPLHEALAGGRSRYPGSAAAPRRLLGFSARRRPAGPATNRSAAPQPGVARLTDPPRPYAVKQRPRCRQTGRPRWCSSTAPAGPGTTRAKGRADRWNASSYTSQALLYAPADALYTPPGHDPEGPALSAAGCSTGTTAARQRTGVLDNWSPPGANAPDPGSDYRQCRHSASQGPWAALRRAFADMLSPWLLPWI